jgi:RHS repeat-associated protein
MVYAANGGGAEVLHTCFSLRVWLPDLRICRDKEFFTYKYFKTDHAGSTRVLLAASTSGAPLDVEQSTDYYPFGLAWETNNQNQNRYLYSGKEIEDAVLNNSPLALYYFGARYYNPTLGRWFNTDSALQVANPYLYCGNNPLMFTDPDVGSSFI